MARQQGEPKPQLVQQFVRSRIAGALSMLVGGAIIWLVVASLESTKSIDWSGWPSLGMGSTLLIAGLSRFVAAPKTTTIAFGFVGGAVLTLATVELLLDDQASPATMLRIVLSYLAIAAVTATIGRLRRTWRLAAFAAGIAIGCLVGGTAIAAFFLIALFRMRCFGCAS